MSRIDPTRIGTIFRSLSSSSAKTANTGGSVTEKPANTKRSQKIRRDDAELKSKIKQRLTKLDLQSDGIKTEAPLIAIQEVIIWEFGEDIVNHPEFKSISSSIVESISAAPHLKEHMKALISSMIEQE